MIKKDAIWILTCFLLSIGVVAILFAMSKDMRNQPGSFLRHFPPHPVTESEALDLGYNSYYIAGGTPHNIYLANYTAPLHIVTASKTLSDTQHVKLNIKGIVEQKFWAIRVKVDSPHYYVTDGAVPAIYLGNVHQWSAERYAYDNTFFQDIVPISNQSFFIRALGNPVRENILGKISTVPPHVKMQKGILQKQVDGVFCTQGMIHYSKLRNELIYLYRYRNEYILMDTTLTVSNKYHTIDTTTRANIEVGTIESSGSTTLSSPSRAVNKHSSIWGNLLFVSSNLLARNEHTKAHDNATVIDVYDLSKGEYQFSFYIYNYKGTEKLKEFSVFGHTFYALFENHLQTWNLEASQFKSPRIFSRESQE